MRVSIFHNLSGQESIDQVVADLDGISTGGFTHVWIPQIFGFDALTLIAAVADRVPGLTFGTSVVPTYPRHPMMLAQQALTTSAVCDGRLLLGIGLSHQPVVEGMWGISFDKPVRHLREYLSILMPLLHDRRVSFKGDTLTGRGGIAVVGPTPPVLVAALGPQMLELAGSRTDGTITWMTGPKTLRAHIAPVLRTAAEKAGRAVPQIVAGFTVCVTDDVVAARARIAEEMVIYGQLPSYRAMLDREGLGGPQDVALVGDEAAVTARLAEIADAGATEVAILEVGSAEEVARTRALLVDVRTRFG